MIEAYLFLGVAAGMRTMTPIAVLCWYMWFGVFPVTGWTFWTANFFSVAVFTVFALGEYYVDLLPTTPSRRKFPLWLARLVFGSLVGALAAAGMNQPLAGGVLIGAAGALIGTFGGYRLRMFAARKMGKDAWAGLAESALAVVISLLAIERLHLFQGYRAMLSLPIFRG